MVVHQPGQDVADRCEGVMVERGPTVDRGKPGRLEHLVAVGQRRVHDVRESEDHGPAGPCAAGLEKADVTR